MSTPLPNKPVAARIGPGSGQGPVLSEGSHDPARHLMHALAWRYAVRRFSDEVLRDAEVDALLAAVRLSASSYGLQPYRIVVVANPDVRRRLVEHSHGQEKAYRCSHLLVLAAQTRPGADTVRQYLACVRQRRGADDREAQAQYGAHIERALASKTSQERLAWAHQQAYIALGTLLTGAAMLGIDACPMGGIEPSGYDAVLGLESRGLTASVVCTIGRRHPCDAAAVAPKVRLPKDELIRWV